MKKNKKRGRRYRIKRRCYFRKRLTESLGRSELNRGPKEAREKALRRGGGRAF